MGNLECYMQSQLGEWLVHRALCNRKHATYRLTCYCIGTPLARFYIQTNKELVMDLTKRFFDHAFRALYKVAYRGHLVACFFLRPKTQGAYVAVWHDDKILLIRNSYKSAYTLPCGGIERKESPVDAAKRELLEEVGLDLPINAFRRVYETVNRTEFKLDHIFLYEVRLVTLPSPKPDGREVVWAEFRRVSDALDMPLFPPVRDYLLQCTTLG